MFLLHVQLPHLSHLSIEVGYLQVHGSGGRIKLLRVPFTSHEAPTDHVTLDFFAVQAQKYARTETGQIEPSAELVLLGTVQLTRPPFPWVRFFGPSNITARELFAG